MAKSCQNLPFFELVGMDTPRVLCLPVCLNYCVSIFHIRMSDHHGEQSRLSVYSSSAGFAVSSPSLSGSSASMLSLLSLAREQREHDQMAAQASSLQVLGDNSDVMCEDWAFAQMELLREQGFDVQKHMETK